MHFPEVFAEISGAGANLGTFRAVKCFLFVDAFDVLSTMAALSEFFVAMSATNKEIKMRIVSYLNRGK